MYRKRSDERRVFTSSITRLADALLQSYQKLAVLKNDNQRNTQCSGDALVQLIKEKRLRLVRFYDNLAAVLCRIMTKMTMNNMHAGEAR